MLWTDKAKKILEKYWGFSELKEKQKDVINELLLGNDVIGLLPTGYGKSMCYLIPPLVTKKAILIISPLISLMDDQKDKLIKMNIPVAALHSNNKNKDRELFQIIDGNIKIIYMSPEYLIKGDGMELAKSLVESNLLGFLAIDEAHCISVWGHDFRPEYLKIKEFRDLYPNIPILAVTATATKLVASEIGQCLNLKNPSVIFTNFDRPKLYLKCIEYKKEKTISIRRKKGDPPKLKDISDISGEIDMRLLKHYFEKYKNEKIIIYANSRQMTLNLANEINNTHVDGRVSEAYHAGMSKGQREKVQNKFSNGDIKIIVSTIAFGMGVDFIVRCVIIIGASSSIEEYWQQIGRAGRDNLDAETVVFFQYKSLAIAKSIVDKECKNPIVKENKLRNINIMKNYLYTDTCRRKFVLLHFNQLPKFFNCNNCDNCCKNDLIDITETLWKIIKNKYPTNNLKNDLNFENIKQNLIAKKLIKVFKNKIFFCNDLSTWFNYIKIKQFELNTLPENLRVKLNIQNLYDPPTEDIFDKYMKELNF